MVLKALLIAAFGSSSAYTVILKLASFIGLYKILEKCGMPGWKGLIPGYNWYSVGKCADRETEGRVVMIAEIASRVFSLFEIFGNAIDTENTAWVVLLGVAAFCFVIVQVVYMFQLMLGIVELFGKTKRWAWLWLFFYFVMAPLWGFSPKYQPLWKIQDLEDKVANYFSNGHASIMEKGLTVNLEERSVTEKFSKKYLLRDIHMNIEPGHMVLLLGGSGAGKTTYVNAINGYEMANAEVTLNGKNLYKQYGSMKYECGFVPQLDLMRGNDSVLHTLLDAARLRLPVNFTEAEREARVNDVMKIFGLEPVKDNLVEKLSGGQRKRLSIAMEFISNPNLFILDEPDSGLDGVMARELMTQLRHIADQGKIVIVITHTPDRVVDLFDDVIVLAKDAKRTGRLAFFGPIKEAREFFGKETMEQIVRSINRPEEGGEGRADEFIMKFMEVNHA